MKRAYLAGVPLAVAFASFALAQPASAPAPLGAQGSAPFEIVKESVDLEAAPDGRFWEVDEVHSRPLTSAGLEALQKVTFSFTQGYEELAVRAYTLKKDGRRIDIPQNQMLQGQGASTAPGFEDTKNITIVFPGLEIGDQAVLITQTRQLVPWFPNVFAFTEPFSRKLAIKDATFAFTSQGKDDAFHISAKDLVADPPLSAGGKTRHVWHYHNDTPVNVEPEAVIEQADLPHVEISTLKDWSAVGSLYADLFKDRAETTPEIAKLAAEVTAGTSDKRLQAKRLTEWVAAHIRYVNIVLGAGGFLPHKAGDVLKNGYGDCKDHVMLLQALLAAKGIKSSPVLIRAGAQLYKLPPTASPFVFDHLITYIPEFQLFTDSTAQYAPFGVLPASDAGKQVVIVATGKVVVTPAVTAANTSASSTAAVTVNPDGSADTDVKYTATGAFAVEMRGFMASLPPDRDGDFFRAALGPGSDGKFQRGQPDALGDSYEFSAHYHTAHLANMPGPGALPAALAYKPFSFSQMVGLSMPENRQTDYACASGTYREDITATLPASSGITTVPPGKSVTTDGIALQTSYENPAPNIIKQHVLLKMDQPPVCRAQDYARIKPSLSAMVGALLAEPLYK